MIQVRHFLHPIQSVKSLYHNIYKDIYRRFVEYKLCKIQRNKRSRCWCEGKLLPFKWHSRYGICANCGCYVNLFPPIDLQELYSLDIYWHLMQKYYGHPTIETLSELHKRDGRLAYWLKLIQCYGPVKGTVIEVGCAPGTLLAELNDKGYKCIGVEADIKTANWIKQNIKVDVRSGFFPDVKLPQCDLFLAFDVLEHSLFPEKFMCKVEQLLCSKGIAIIQTPIERYGFDPPFGDAFKNAFREFEHLFLFTDKAMMMLAEHAGLEIINANERLWLHHETCIFRKP